MTDAPGGLQDALQDRYRIERELGQGGMATVYLAADLKHGRPVALKVLRPDVSAALGRERFLREIETTARLRHPNVLPLLDSGVAGGTLYYVMPYVEGASLRQALEREKQLPLDEVLRIAREVADALSHAHRHGVVHRDIKPENVLIDSGHAVVADFGIARAVDRVAGGGLTETGMALGTPAYMSPEQAAGGRDLDGRSDVYSLGCVVYEMLAGQPPFTGPTGESIVYQQLGAAPPDVTGIRPGVPAGVAAALKRALDKTPADRFRTAAAFAEALEAGASAVAGPVSTAATARAPFSRFRWRTTAVVLAAVALLAGALALGRRLLPGRVGAGPPRTAIAVLPLENLSPQSPYAYFAAGLHDELLTQLAKVAALHVIGRTSVRAYEGTSKSLRQIGEDLSVGSIVEGSVQVVGTRLRVIVQLIDPASETHLWAETYDRTIDDAFAVQSEIARRIVEVVGATLTREEAGAIAAAPTRDPKAYEFYLQGIEYARRPGLARANIESAQQLFDSALALDPSFAGAYAQRSLAHSLLYMLGYDHVPERLARAQRDVEEALRLAPDLPQSRIAAGSLQLVRRDTRRALAEFEAGASRAPNDAGLWTWIGIANFDLGNWDSAVVAYERARRLDPRDANLAGVLGDAYHVLHRYQEAVEAYRREIALAPDVVQARLSLAWSYILWKGELDSLRAVLRRQPPDADPGMGGGSVAQNRLALLVLERQGDSVLALLRAVPETAGQGEDARLGRVLWTSQAYLLRGDSAAARAAYDTAAALLDAQARSRPEDTGVHFRRGVVMAALGRRAEALREADWIAGTEAYRRSADVAVMRAEILARLGETAPALGDLERAFVNPSGISAPLARLEPRWDRIRDDPRFQALLAKYAEPRAR